MYSGYHSWSHIDALALRPDKFGGASVSTFCSFGLCLHGTYLQGYYLASGCCVGTAGSTTVGDPGHRLWVLFGDFSAGIWGAGAEGFLRWHHCTNRRLLTRKRSSRRTSTRWIRHQRLDPFHCKSTDEMSHQDGPGDANYPWRSYFDKLKLWYRICNVEDELVGPLIAGRLYGRASKVATTQLRVSMAIVTGLRMRFSGALQGDLQGALHGTSGLDFLEAVS